VGYLKQTDAAFAQAPYDAIQTDGCLWRSLLYAGEFFTGQVLTADEIKYAFHYSIPDYMEDHRHPGKDRCYILSGGHAEICRVSFFILGERSASIEYAYRRDFYPDDKYVIGREADLG